MTIVRIDRGSNHWYELDGVRVPSVTGILRAAIPKQDILVPWAGRKSADYVIDNWEALTHMRPSERHKAVAGASKASNAAAAKKGTRVHLLGAELAVGNDVTVPPELAGHLEAYTQFLFDYNADVTQLEALAWSQKHGHVGTLDMGANIIVDGVTESWLIDVKTGNNVYDEVAFQLAGYRYADTLVETDPVTGEPVEKEMPQFDKCGVLHVRANGYSLHPVTVTEDTYRGFLYLKEAGAAIAANRYAVQEPLENPPLLDNPWI